MGMMVLWSFLVSYSKSLVCLSGTNRSSKGVFFISLYVCLGPSKDFQAIAFKKDHPIIGQIFLPLEGKDSIFTFYPIT